METFTSALAGKRVLVIEDEYLIADDVAAELRMAGAEVIGPAGSMPHGMRLMAQSGPIDMALLDINLRGTLAYPLVDELIGAGVQVVITSGYDEEMMPERYRHLPRCDKPTSARNMMLAVTELLATPIARMPPPQTR